MTGEFVYPVKQDSEQNVDTCLAYRVEAWIERRPDQIAKWHDGCLLGLRRLDNSTEDHDSCQR